MFSRPRIVSVLTCNRDIIHSESAAEIVDTVINATSVILTIISPFCEIPEAGLVDVGQRFTWD
jgi:hypothetical protein